MTNTPKTLKDYNFIHFTKWHYRIKIELNYKNGRFSCCGSIYNTKRTRQDACICAGQCEDKINKILKGDELRAKIYDQRKRNHLNDLHAGTKRQEERLKANRIKGRASNYTETCKKLEKAGLLIDNGYKFGTGRQTREISKEDDAKIKELLTIEQ